MHTETISPTCFRLIKDLSTFSPTENFYLVGGTSLALQLGHRTSIDLDFFTTGEFDPRGWEPELTQFAEITRKQVRPNNLIATLNGVKTEFLYFAYPPKFDLIEWEGIKMLSAKDIGLFKILALLGRNRKKDIVDLYFIDKLVMDLDEVVAQFVNLYDQGDVNLLRQVELLFDDIQVEKSSNPMMLTEFDWNSAYSLVKQKLISSIHKRLD